MAIDPGVWNAIGGAAAGIVTTLGGFWIWIQKQRKDMAATKADIAESKSAEVVADAQQTIYKTLVSRVESLEADLRSVRDELKTEREHSRSQEQKLAKLELWIVQQGLTPPIL